MAPPFLTAAACVSGGKRLQDQLRVTIHAERMTMLAYIRQHMLALAGIAAACGAIIVLIHPHQIGAWLIGGLGLAWLAVATVNHHRGGKP